MAKKRRIRYDEDVIRTEPDKRRATGNDADEDEFEAEEAAVSSNPSGWSTIATSRYQRAVSRRSLRKNQTSFKFLLLPAEIRNMVYRYVVVSKSPVPIDLGDIKTFRSGGIETAILLANHQVYHEAAKIMYDENECMATWTPQWLRAATGIAIREDDPKTTSTTARSLRSGRDISMVKHSGLIYLDVARRLRNIDFVVELADRKKMCNHQAMHDAARVHASLQKLYWFLYDTLAFDEYGESLRPDHESEYRSQWRHKGWVIIVKSLGTTSILAMKTALRPLLKSMIADLISFGEIRMKLDGKFPKGWKKVFHRSHAFKGFTIEKLEEDSNLIKDRSPRAWSDCVWDDDSYWESDFAG
ncbi:MAG: hypothetical protein M1818_004202 [Claussenomyces sp. TS43310]|nr:MAG: hypothetical protein M1818_004202 [Claussenomyces sp. TS43310]